MSSGTVTQAAVKGAILIEHEVGLHARPSVKLTRLAKTFASRIELGLSEDGPWIDAKSIVRVMAFKAVKGATLHFRADGEDANAAVAALIALVRRDFDESRGDG
ncbi:MAG TPA: HPr family phosphocarrier protein [Dongiaceae bacterium]|nr:HPr family phosphocarrier protein [Dongiaceae bacterium]